MIRSIIRSPFAWSPIVALVAQLVLAGVAAAVTGGGDFPRAR